MFKMFGFRNLGIEISFARRVAANRFKEKGNVRVFVCEIPYCNLLTVMIYPKKDFFFLFCCDPSRDMASPFLRFLDHTEQRITIGRTPLDE
jgi:hypothetical protein